MSALAQRARAKILRAHPFYREDWDDLGRSINHIVRKLRGSCYAIPGNKRYFGFPDGSVLRWQAQPPPSAYFHEKYGERVEKRRAQLSWKAYQL